jgi:hypothetical protein
LNDLFEENDNLNDRIVKINPLCSLCLCGKKKAIYKNIKTTETRRARRRNYRILTHCVLCASVVKQKKAIYKNIKTTETRRARRRNYRKLTHCILCAPVVKKIKANKPRGHGEQGVTWQIFYSKHFSNTNSG